MTQGSNISSGLVWLIGIAATIIILAGLKSAETIVIPILLSVFLGIICMPPLHFMTRNRVPPILGIMIIVFFLLVFGSVLGLIISSTVDTFLTRLPDYQLRLEVEMVSLLPFLEQAGIPLTREQLLEHLNPSQAMDWVGKALSNLSSLLTNLFLILFIVVFLLLEEATFGQKLRQAIPAVDESLGKARNFICQVNKYLVMKTIISITTGLLLGLWVWFLGLDFPLLWGLIAVLMNYIPNVGSILAAIPPILLAIVQLGVPDALLVASGYLAVNVAIGNIIEPRVMGRGLGLSPLVVFLSLVLWGWLLGAVGMFLSIPLTMIVKIALEQYPSTRWLGVMIGDGLAVARMDAAVQERREQD